MVEFVRRQGYKYIRARIDGEPSRIALARKVKDDLLLQNIKMDVEIAPRYGSQSMGAVGACQRTLHAQ
eukprot:13842674-Heterocapsa_arctica.AAC.1